MEQEERRERLMRELPRALRAAEERAFEAGKRAESLGVLDRAAILFDVSRRAFRVREELKGLQPGAANLDEALQRGSAVLMDWAKAS